MRRNQTLIAVRLLCGAALAGVAACGPMPVAKSDDHLNTARSTVAAEKSAIPAPDKQVALPPPPAAKPAELKYSVVVNDIPIREVLFAMAKETKLNIDIHPAVEGKVTLNAVDQSIRQNPEPDRENDQMYASRKMAPTFPSCRIRRT